MHSEVLTARQIKLLPLIKQFSNKFGLAGGTAIAYHLGHRHSIDFDLFSLTNFYNRKIQDAIREKHTINRVYISSPYELTLLVDNIKMTFYKYPFKISFTEPFESAIKIPDLLTLAAMKAFAMGKRAKWKDYVDMYFIFQRYSLYEIANCADKLFKGEFNERLFREQLAYFKDVDYSEKVDFMPGFAVEDEEVKSKLTKISLQR